LFFHSAGIARIISLIRCMQESVPEATKAAADGAKAFEIADDVAAIKQVASCTLRRGEKLERRRG
jgi:hypothetical protein